MLIDFVLVERSAFYEFNYYEPFSDCSYTFSTVTTFWEEFYAEPSNIQIQFTRFGYGFVSASKTEK